MKIKNLNTVNLEKIDFFNNLDLRYKPSSVFILIFSSKDKDEILFLKRSNNLELHKGEICFPGGSYEDNDQDLLSTAYRELEEEVGIKKSDINALAFLEDEITRIKNSNEPNKEKKIKRLEKRYTIGNLNFDAVVIADFDESLKSVTTSLLYTDVKPENKYFITLNQWFDESLFCLLYTSPSPRDRG